MKRSAIIITVLISGLFFTFNTGSQTRTDTENFEVFYSKYYADSIFQLNRTLFPLPGYNSDTDSEIPHDIAKQMGIITTDEYYWEKEEWSIIKPIGDDDEYMTKKIIKTDTLATEELIIPDSGFRIVRKYKPIEGKWFLVYYFYQDI